MRQPAETQMLIVEFMGEPPSGSFSIPESATVRVWEGLPTTLVVENGHRPIAVFNDVLRWSLGGVDLVSRART